MVSVRGTGVWGENRSQAASVLCCVLFFAPCVCGTVAVDTAVCCSVKHVSYIQVLRADTVAEIDEA